MPRFYHAVILLTVYFLSSSNGEPENRNANRTMASSRALYDLAEIRRASARLSTYRNQTHRNSTTRSRMSLLDRSSSKVYDAIEPKSHPRRFLLERLKTSIIGISLGLGCMVAIVSICIFTQYMRLRQRPGALVRETRTPSNRPHVSRSDTPFL